MSSRAAYQALPSASLNEPELSTFVSLLLREARHWVARLVPCITEDQLAWAWQQVFITDQEKQRLLLAGGQLLGQGAQGDVYSVDFKGRATAVKVTSPMLPQTCKPGKPLFNCTAAELGVALLCKLAAADKAEGCASRKLLPPAVAKALAHMVQAYYVVLQPVQLQPGTRQGEPVDASSQMALRVGVVYERMHCDLRHVISGLHSVKDVAGVGLRPVDLSALLDLAHQLYGALEAVHAAGLIHGDIKPGNLLVRHLDVDGEASSTQHLARFQLKLGDLGTLMSVETKQGAPPPLRLYTKQYCCMTRLQGFARDKKAGAPPGSHDAGSHQVHDTYAAAMCVLEMLFYSSHSEHIRNDPIEFWQQALRLMSQPEQQAITAASPLAPAKSMPPTTPQAVPAQAASFLYSAASTQQLSSTTQASTQFMLDSRGHQRGASTQGSTLALTATTTPYCTPTLLPSSATGSQLSSTPVSSPLKGATASPAGPTVETPASYTMTDVLLAGGTSWYHFHLLLPSRRNVLAPQPCWPVLEQLLKLLGSCLSQRPTSRPAPRLVVLELVRLRRMLQGLAAVHGDDTVLLMLDDMDFPFTPSPGMTRPQYLQRLAAVQQQQQKQQQQQAGARLHSRRSMPGVSMSPLRRTSQPDQAAPAHQSARHEALGPLSPPSRRGHAVLQSPSYGQGAKPTQSQQGTAGVMLTSAGIRPTASVALPSSTSTHMQASSAVTAVTAAVALLTPRRPAPPVPTTAAGSSVGASLLTRHTSPGFVAAPGSMQAGSQQHVVVGTSGAMVSPARLNKASSVAVPGLGVKYTPLVTLAAQQQAATSASTAITGGLAQRGTHAGPTSPARMLSGGSLPTSLGSLAGYPRQAKERGYPDNGSLHTKASSGLDSTAGVVLNFGAVPTQGGGTASIPGFPLSTGVSAQGLSSCITTPRASGGLTSWLSSTSQLSPQQLPASYLLHKRASAPNSPAVATQEVPSSSLQSHASSRRSASWAGVFDAAGMVQQQPAGLFQGPQLLTCVDEGNDGATSSQPPSTPAGPNQGSGRMRLTNVTAALKGGGTSLSRASHSLIGTAPGVGAHRLSLQQERPLYGLGAEKVPKVDLDLDLELQEDLEWGPAEDWGKSPTGNAGRPRTQRGGSGAGRASGKQASFSMWRCFGGCFAVDTSM